ncbi:MAG: type III glutamate--ammonia ligase [Gammaproteobacteria bacterium]|nr:type III glutamate--ammonia ligase [Gammaproteobacteria bacterium]
MTTNLEKVAKEKGIKYFLVSFVDLLGVLRAKMVPARAIAQMQRDGAGFAGFATWLDMTPAHPDLFGRPDADSLIQLPWKPEVAWLASDLWMSGEEVVASPRAALKKQVAAADAQGYRIKTGVECEYFLLSPDGKELSDPRDTQTKPCYDQSYMMRRFDVTSRIVDTMIELGWEPYQADHEDANGQFELNWGYDDCLVTADRHVFFKYLVKQIAEDHGYRATFMPKPFINLTGNGCHAHVSLWDKSGRKNLFHDPKGELSLSKLAYHFLGGIMHNAEALCSIFNPTVNSYKRLSAPRTTSGATWAPGSITYGGNNRTHMIRIPGSDRLELRLMDGAANPYLMQAGIIAAGLDGIANKRDPGKRLDIDMFAEGHTITDCKRLPLNMLDAVRLTDKSNVLRERMGDELIDCYVKFKMDEWRRYGGCISQWELDNTLDC